MKQEQSTNHFNTSCLLLVFLLYILLNQISLYARHSFIVLFKNIKTHSFAMQQILHINDAIKIHTSDIIAHKNTIFIDSTEDFHVTNL